jgi:hypothetical protein
VQGDQGYLLIMLRACGVPEAGLTRLFALRQAWQQRVPALDGLAPDPRLEFARWLYERGHIAG